MANIVIAEVDGMRYARGAEQALGVYKVPYQPEEILSPCLEKLDSVPLGCADEMGRKPTKAEMEKCTEHVTYAGQCLNGMRDRKELVCAYPMDWGQSFYKFFSPYYFILQGLFKIFQTSGAGLDVKEAKDMQSALHSIYLASIAHCDLRLISITALELEKAIKAGNLGEVAKMVGHAKPNIQFGTSGLTFTDRPATFLLLWALNKNTGNANSEMVKHLDDVFRYFPRGAHPIPDVTR